LYIYNNGSEQVVLFAHSLSAAEQEQAVFWYLISYSPHDLLVEAPSLDVQTNQTGGRVGLLSLQPGLNKKGELVS
jgi:hypothetical protein